jgi:hypothetical protein
VDADAKIDRLKQQLSRQSLGPLAVIADQTISSLRLVLVSAVCRLRQAVYEQPLVTLLLSFQAGYAVARLGRGDARN